MSQLPQSYSRGPPTPFTSGVHVLLPLQTKSAYPYLPASLLEKTMEVSNFEGTTPLLVSTSSVEHQLSCIDYCSLRVPNVW